MEFFFTSSLNWWVCSDNYKINLLRYAITSKKCFRSYLNLGKSMSLIALTFSESVEISFPDVMCLKNISSDAAKTRLSFFSFKPEVRILFKTCLVWISSLFRIHTHMMISSWVFLSPSEPSIIFSMCCWKKLYFHLLSNKVKA